MISKSYLMEEETQIFSFENEVKAKVLSYIKIGSKIAQRDANNSNFNKLYLSVVVLIAALLL